MVSLLPYSTGQDSYKDPPHFMGREQRLPSLGGGMSMSQACGMGHKSTQPSWENILPQSPVTFPSSQVNSFSLDHTTTHSAPALLSIPTQISPTHLLKSGVHSVSFR